MELGPGVGVQLKAVDRGRVFAEDAADVGDRGLRGAQGDPQPQPGGEDVGGGGGGDVVHHGDVGSGGVARDYGEGLARAPDFLAARGVDSEDLSALPDLRRELQLGFEDIYLARLPSLQADLPDAQATGIVQPAQKSSRE